ncbi:hypothetical protein EON66_09135, partial [archaeon]
MCAPTLLQEETPRAAAVAGAVLKRCEEKLTVPTAQAISHFAALARAASKQHMRAAARASPGKSKAAGGDAADVRGEEDAEEDGDEELASSAPWAKTDMVHRLILEVTAVIPSVLLLLLPSLMRDMETEDVAHRQEAMELVGRLFALPVLVTASEGAYSGRQPIGRAY